MPRTLVQDWIAQTYQSRSPNSSSRRLLNCYIESTEGAGKFPSIVIGTPGTRTFTYKNLPAVSIVAIQGNGGFPNVVSVTCSAAHGLSAGALFNIIGTANYDELQLVVKAVPSPTSIEYETLSNSASDAELGGNLVPTGESPITDVSETSSCRGLYTTSTGRVFGAWGPAVFEIFADGSWALVQSIGQADTRVSFADDGRSLIFVDGQSMYRLAFNTGSCVNITGSLDFSNPAQVVYLNGRIVAINQDPAEGVNNRFYWCDLLASGSWDPLNFATAESSADALTAIAVREGELWLFGPRSYEVWRRDEDPELPFTKVGGSSTEVGAGAPNSVVSIAGQIFWLGSSNSGQNQVFMSNGYAPARISDHALEYLLGQIGNNTSDAVAFTYQQEGHVFYVLTLIQGNRTFVYDMTSQLWHERSTRDPLVNAQNYWGVLYATLGFGRVICGGLDTARALTLELDQFTEWDGRPIVRLMQGPILFQNLSQLFHYRFEVDMETGVGRQAGEPYNSGIQTATATDPVMMLQHSDDGGHTWSSIRKAKIGKVGQYRARVAWMRLGRSRERVYRISMSDAVKFHLLGARVTASPGVMP